MRVAVIDLGSNSIRLEITEIGDNRALSLVHKEKRVVKLGQDVFKSGVLHPDAKARTLQAFVDFKAKADELCTSKILAIGTSALRDAKDGDDFIEEVRKKTGITITKISGDEEARLVYVAALSDPKITEKDFTLIDIGGGSTELIFCKNRNISSRISLKIGTVRAFDLYLKGNPPVPSEGIKDPVAALRVAIQSELRSLSYEYHPPLLLGTSGTSRIISNIVKAGGLGSTISIEVVAKVVSLLSPLRLEELREIPGMDKERADVIFGGAVILEELMRALNVAQLVPIERSLRDGVLLDWISH